MHIKYIIFFIKNIINHNQPWGNIMKKNIVAVLVSISFIFLSTSVSFSYTPGSVEVTVKDRYSGALIEGAELVMEPGGYTEITDVTGTATFTGIIPYRNYTVTVSLDGYSEGHYGEGRTGLIWVQTGQTTLVTVPVTKKALITGQVTSGGVPIEGAWVNLFYKSLLYGDSKNQNQCKRLLCACTDTRRLQRSALLRIHTTR